MTTSVCSSVSSSLSYQAAQRTKLGKRKVTLFSYKKYLMHLITFIYVNLLVPNMGSSMGSYKLNTSGVSSGDHGSSGYGGILRDEGGCWIRGFTGHPKTGSMSVEAEILAILKGVELIDSLRLQNTTLETDSLVALRALEKPDLCTKSLDWIAKISDCQKLVKKNEITLTSITREENKCAKFLAELGMDDDDDDDDDEYADVLDPPPGIETLIMADKPKVSNDQT